MAKTIQEKKKAKTGNLKIAYEDYRAFVNQATDGVFIFQDGRFKLKNSRFQALFGSPGGSSFCQDPGRVFLLNRLKEYHRWSGEKQPHDKGVLNFRFIMASKAAGIRKLEAVLTRGEYQGKPAIHGMIRDHTQSGGRTIELTPITVAAHEIRSAITVINGCTRILFSKQLGPLTPAQEKLVKNCSRGCDRLKSLVEQIFDHTRAEANEIKMDFRKRNIGDCIIRVYEECRMVAQNRNIALSRRISKNAVLTLSFDRDKIERVLLNLINNALENTPEGGKVELQVKAFNENVTKVCVVDTGRGVPAEEREDIFQAFNRGKNAKSGRGLGLGLAICREIIDLHNGEIWVEPRKGGGSKFIFTLPVGRS